MTASRAPGARPVVRLGLRENIAQFSLLVLVNAFVGAMAGMERSILPLLAEEEFRLAARTAILSFIAVFGVSKALTNYFAGRFSDRIGRRQILIAGWILATPVPFLLMWAPTWSWVLVANALLGISQGLTWSTTVIMKIDLVGPRQRGLAMGFNEFAGYIAVAGAAWMTGWIAAREGLRPEPFYLGVLFVAMGLALSVFLVRETQSHVSLEAQLASRSDDGMTSSAIFWRTSIGDRNLSSISQAGLVNNLNDGMVWGLFPLFFSAAGLSLERVATLAAIYPATWGLAQLGTGALSDRIGRKWLIASGMWLQAVGIGVVVIANGFIGFAMGAILLGIGTAMVYPTLLAAIGDVASPAWRASAIGVYRFWRDLGYAVGAVIAGLAADLMGLSSAMWIVAGLTFVSGLIVASRMAETIAVAGYTDAPNRIMRHVPRK
jgi:MFS family permease